MIIKETLKIVLKTGCLENIPFGTTYDEFVLLFGRRRWEENEDFDGLNLYKVGMSTFAFSDFSDDAELISYSLDFWPKLPKENFRMNYNNWNCDLTIDKAEFFLKENKIQFKEKLTKDEYIRILSTEGNATIIFSNQWEQKNHKLTDITINKKSHTLPTWFSLDWQSEVVKIIEYGTWEDWQLIRKFYGDKKIIEAITSANSLDEKTINFFSIAYNIPKEEFKCLWLN